MELVEFTGDVEVIQKLGTFPNAEDGLTAEDLKKKFDEAPTAIKKYLNETLVPEVNRIGKNAGKPISVTITTVDGALTADKIYAELHAAHVAGQTVHCKLPDGSVLALATADENGLLFQGENGRDYQQIIIGADGTITYKSGKYALLGELVTDATIGVYPSGDGYESTDTLEDLQESAKAGRTIVCNLEVGDGELLRLPMTKREDDAFHFSTVFEGKEYMVTITADGVTVEISECGGGNSGGNVDQGGLTKAQIAALDGMFKVCAFNGDPYDAYTAFKNAFGLSGGTVEPEEPDIPDVPDVPVEPDKETYTVTNNLTNCASNNRATSVVEGSSYTATLTASDGYTLEGASVSVVVNGEDVTDTAYADGVITIQNVMGNVVITATAVEIASSDEIVSLAWIGTDGESYIDTDFAPRSVNHKYLLGFQFDGEITPSGYFFGIRNDQYTKPMWSLFISSRPQRVLEDIAYGFDISFGSREGLHLSTGQDIYDSAKSGLRLTENPAYVYADNSVFKIYKNEEMTEQPTGGTFAKLTLEGANTETDDRRPVSPCYIGKVNNLYTDTVSPTPAKFFCFKVWDENDNLIVDMKPAKKGSTIGMYDYARQTFYGNAGTGSITYGEVSA